MARESARAGLLDGRGGLRGAGRTSSRAREVTGIILLGIALFIGLSVASVQVGSRGLMGPCGAYVGLGSYALFGVGAYLLAGGLAAIAVRCLQGLPLIMRSAESFGTIGAALCGSVLLHLLLGRHRLGGFGPGGLVGEYGAELLSSLIGRAGAALFGTVGVAASIVLATPLSVRATGRVALAIARGTGRLLLGTIGNIFPERHEHELQDDEDEDEDEPARKRERSISSPVIELPMASRRPQRRDTCIGIGPQSELEQLDPIRPPAKKRKREDESQRAKADDSPPVVALTSQASAPILIEDDKTEATAIGALAYEQLKGAPQIVEPTAAPKKTLAIVPPPSPSSSTPKPDYIPAAGGYHLPDLELLDYEDTDGNELDRDAMLKLAERLVETLEHYKVRGRVVQIHPGPVITMYEFVPEKGTKISSITSLDKDLAMSLEAMSVRIVAPIPGKGSIGFEVPNKTRANVYLKEILLDEAVHKAKSKLTIGLGKDIAGLPVAVDLARMPHLLVAGTTGSGKSVGVNGMICSILFNATPEEVRLLMIDPKMLELSIYEGIPHLLLPVVTDPKKANLALRWAVDEMDRRYELISKSGVRDIVSYNKKVEKILSDGPPKIREKKIKVYITDDRGDKHEVEVVADEAAVRDAGGVVDQNVRDEISAAHAARQKLEQDAEPMPRKLPFIVVIIDEFADLMMVASKEVETSVARIAQKARAAGIHLIVATQRPSVDVITGLIKANFPSRIGFQVASKIDSRTILDQQGAENLLGMGDMLFTDRGQSLRRIHGALVTEVEIKRLVDFLKLQGQPVYDMDILKPRIDEEGDFGGVDENQDEHYDLAVRLVCETRQASVSMIQRRLQVGYNRAARMVERMEREGIVGAANGAKPREVLAQAV